MKKKISNIILILIFFTGLSLLLYPTVSDYWNSLHQSKIIDGYTEAVKKIDKDEYERLLEEAEIYNTALLKKSNRFIFSDREREEYESLLNVSGFGVMGYIEIPSINCKLPIYHGVSESVLQRAVGHLEGSSLPAGGEGTHCVLSGHRGLPSAKLFSNLDKLYEGDHFTIYILNEVLTYEVDKISIVLPEELDDLAIDKTKDYCTLVTCTPYGINTHRLLVRGHRVENTNENEYRIVSEARKIEPILTMQIFAVPFFVLLLFGLLRRTGRKK